jgi:hypothetical protein
LSSNKETPAAKSNRLVNVAKDQIDKIVLEAAKDPAYFGRPSIEILIQGGAVEAVVVNENRSHK